MKNYKELNLNEDGTSSDDPEMIKPIGFVIHVSYEKEDQGNKSISSNKRSSRKNIISHKDLNYKQITYIEAWGNVKCLDLSKEKRLIMIVREYLI